jgi:hypothetical protein
MMEHSCQGHQGSANMCHIHKVYNVVWETLKCTNIVDEYLELHKSNFDLKYEVFFTSPESPSCLVSFPQQEDPNVPNEQEKATI